MIEHWSRYQRFAWAATLGLLLAAASNARSDEPPFGIERRVPMTTSRVVGTPEPPPPYRIENAFPKLQFNRPIELAHAPGSNRLFVVELDGKIQSFVADPACEKFDLFFDGKTVDPDYRCVYGIAFSPNFETDREVYLCYVTRKSVPDGTRVSRFKVSRTEPPVCDPASEERLLTWLSGGHNGGSLQFGLDGCLYISSGDGTSPSPPDIYNTGQDISDLLSSVLRIDVRTRGEKPYTVPTDNPFVNTPGARPEVWAYGFRNPWKISIDPQSGHVWLGDVGWELWEMIYRVERGGNYGWSVMEGTQPVRPEANRGPTTILPPTAEHSHTESRSITGGYVYRGSRLPALRGAYVYGDYETGKVWGLRHDGQKVTWRQELAQTTLKLVSFGEDSQGELYLVDYGGLIYRLEPTPPVESLPAFPRRLSDTGLFTSVPEHEPAPGAIPYSVTAEPWADGARAERFLALPGESSIKVTKGRNEFPAGTVFVKTLSLPKAREEASPHEAAWQRVETQLLHFDGQMWRGYGYAWNDEQTDAELIADEGLDRKPSGHTQTWHFASRAECLLCHNFKAGSVLGFTLPQLDRPHRYAERTDGQLRTLGHVGVLGGPVQEIAGKLPRMASPDDSSATLDQRARAYLHVNCSHCHQRGGGGTASIELLYNFDLAKTNAVGVRPSLGTFDLAGAQIVRPGDPLGSILYLRMATLGGGHMPRAGATNIDERGLRLVHDWIAQLSPASPPAGHTVKLNLSPATDEKLLTEQLDRLHASTRGSLALLEAVDANELPPVIREAAIRHAVRHSNPLVRGLFERFIPESERQVRLGNVVRPADILSRAGNAQRGRQLFFETAAMQCKNCHQVQGRGESLGPDLTTIGRKHNRAALLESILEPSKTIEPKFVTYVMETKDGEVHTGLIESRNEREVVLKDGQKKLIRVPLANVEVLVPQQKSLMPELLVRDLTAQDAADLLEFLASLR